nr:hypothetical protein [Enterovibrio nigricans]
MMQLVRHAYENVAKGKGESLLTIPASASVREGGVLEQEVHKARRERDELNALNQLLKTQLAHAQAKNKKTPAGNTAEYERKIAMLEGELVLLKDERNRLKAQKEEAKSESIKLAADLRRALSENEVLETELDNTPRLQIAGFGLWIKRAAMPFIVTASLFAIGVYGANNVDWVSVKSWFVTSPPPPPAPALKVVHAVKKAQEADVKVEQENVQVSDVFDAEKMPFIQLTNVSGSWSLAAYTESERPILPFEVKMAHT